MPFTISFAIIGVRVAVVMAQSSKPDVCNPEYTPSIKCYPPGLGDGRPPCCSELGYCKNGNYTNVDIMCTSPSLCDSNNDPECYYFSGMPVCCTSELACSFTSNLECDTNKYKPQAPATTPVPTTLAPVTTTTTLTPVTATHTLPAPVTTSLPPVTTSLSPDTTTTTLPPVTTTLTPVTTALATPATEEAANPDDNTNTTLAKATKIFKNEKIPKADKIMSPLIVDAKAEKMSVRHEEAKAKTEKMFDGKAEKKMSIDQINAEAKAEKIVDAKAEKMSVHQVEAKAEKMLLVHHVVAKSKTEKIDDAKAVKMSVHHEEAKAKTKKMFDGKAGKKEHSMSIHHEAKATKGLLVHDSVFQLRN